MRARFPFETSNGLILAVDISVWCHDRDGDYGFEDMVLATPQGTDFDENLLSPKDFARLEEECDRVAADKSCDAYQDYLESEADRQYDLWKDEQFDRS